MAPVYTDDSDPWLTEYDACEDQFRAIMEQLTARNKHPKASRAYASLSSNVRILLKKYSQNVQQLKVKVDNALRSKTITIEEAERRTRQIELLQSKDVQLQRLYNARTDNFTSSRTNLFTSSASAFADGGTTSWAADDDDDEKLIDIEVSVTDVRAQQDRILQEQDKGLEELCKVIARQKEIGQNISNEVDHQNEIIDNLADHMDRTDESLITKTRQVQNISSRDRTCGYWIVIILLFISIVVVSLV
ncbi:syntaxin 8 [Megalopta genalis]|uniref:syntaxin 8 n=1 Tax=Megalopta genalis TaxID=115081 RepID=UPI00144345DB|nr:syntaxin-8 [Megalopta genalis]